MRNREKLAGFAVFFFNRVIVIEGLGNNFWYKVSCASIGYQIIFKSKIKNCDNKEMEKLEVFLIFYVFLKISLKMNVNSV
jgi:hypothetical protein